MPREIPRKRLQIFVSSTFTDLRDERKAAVETIVQAGHIPAGMELFSAGDQSQLETIKRWIEQSDVLMLILGGRYGSMEPISGKSYIQIEYEHAEEKNIPVCALVISKVGLDKRVRVSGQQILELDNPRQYKEFRKKVLGRMSRFWDDARDIELETFRALNEFANDPHYEYLEGWVPGGVVASARATQRRLSTLTTTNETLHEVIRRLSQPGQVSLDSLSGGKEHDFSLDSDLANTLDKSGLRSAFRIKVENPARDIRVKELVAEECTRQENARFHLLASSGNNYLNVAGKVWDAGLGEAIVERNATLTVILESPFSPFSKTRALANRFTHHNWQEKISIDRLKGLATHDNVTVRVTEHPVNCSLFFTNKAVFYDPYLWAKPKEHSRTENNFWVFEFMRMSNPDYDYECYQLLARHFNFLLSTSVDLIGFLDEHEYITETEQFQQDMKTELEKLGVEFEKLGVEFEKLGVELES